MKFVIDPSIANKIGKMKERVRWNHPLITQGGIDQTRFVLDDGHNEDAEFSFLAIGDSGTGRYRGDSPQQRIADSMLSHVPECRFVLHTGDVVYLVGSREQYPENFIKPYSGWLVGGENPKAIAYDRMVFKHPFFPVLGNHDYYDLHWLYGLLGQTAMPVRYLLRRLVDLDVGWHGSYTGDAFARAFLDYLQGCNERQIDRHLTQHYTAVAAGRRCLAYQPGQFTRLPNRYYTFRYGGIDFFALDSNTFNQPLPMKDTVAQRRSLEDRRQYLLQKQQGLLQGALDQSKAPSGQPEPMEEEDVVAELEQLNEQLVDLEKQQLAPQDRQIDSEQLQWLQERLMESWQDPEARGRVIIFHHPPYVTESTKWQQGQTLAVRYHLRQVLNTVKQEVGELVQGRSLVDLVLTGHAHCLEYLRTEDTGHADSHIHWLICGGSGYSLRRQRSEGPVLEDALDDAEPGTKSSVVARSHLFVGRTGKGSQRRRPYSFVRIDVKAGRSPQFIVHPCIVEKFQGEWKSYQLDPLILNPSAP